MQDRKESYGGIHTAYHSLNADILSFDIDNGYSYFCTKDLGLE